MKPAAPSHEVAHGASNATASAWSRAAGGSRHRRASSRPRRRSASCRRPPPDSPSLGSGALPAPARARAPDSGHRPPGAAGSRRRAGVDVGDRQAAVGLPKALHVGEALDPGRLRDRRCDARWAPVLDQGPLIDSPPPWTGASSVGSRSGSGRPCRRNVDRELLAEAALLHERGDGRVAEEEVELLPVVGRDRCGATPNPSRALTRSGWRASPGAIARAPSCAARRSRAPRRSPVRLQLVSHRSHTSASGSRSDGRSASRARESTRMIQVVEGHDEPDVVLVDEAGSQRVHGGSAIRGTIAWRSEWKRAGASRAPSAPTTTAPAAWKRRTMSTRCPARR